MTDSPLRMGYVGCGFIAQNIHLPNFAAIADCQLVALAETRPLLAQRVAARYGVPTVYASHLELAQDPNVEAVGVSAGFAQQGEIAADLLRAGKHVFMEKPMAVSIAQAERILTAAREGNARLMVAYMKRYDPGNALAHDVIAGWRATGEKGNVLYARAHGFCGNWIAGLDSSTMISTDEPYPPAPYQEQLPAWLPEEQVGAYTGYLQQYTHNVNLLRYLLDAGDDAQVRAVDLDADGLTGLTSFTISQTRCVVESASTQFHAWDEHTQVYFEGGWVRVAPQPLAARPGVSNVEIYEGGEVKRYSYPIATPLEAWPYGEEAKFFVRALRSGEPFRSSGEDTLTDVRLFEELYQQRLGLTGAKGND